MDTLLRIEKEFLSMVENKKVNILVIKDLDKIKEELNIYKKQELSKNQLTSDNFSRFHAIETQMRVIDKMINRINMAEEIHDNPKVADDALMILPLIRDLNTNIKIENDSNFLMELSSDLQILAMKVNMYPLLKDVREKINKEVLEKDFNKFISNIGEEIERI